MKQKFFDQKWVLRSIYVATALLASNAVLNALFVIGAWFDIIQFGNDPILSSFLFCLGWVSPVSLLFLDKGLRHKFGKMKGAKVRAWLFAFLASGFCIFYTVATFFSFDRKPVASIAYERGGQILAYEDGWVTNICISIEQKKELLPNIFWIERKFFDSEACNPKLSLLPNRTLKCSFDKGWWQKENYAEVMLKY